VQVVAQILGEIPLPWEGEGRAKEMLKRAGRFWSALMGLLERDPEQRSTIDTFMQQCANVLSTTTQQGTAASDNAPGSSKASSTGAY
jgi:hypothetical protein